jgi:glutamine synthetase
MTKTQVVKYARERGVTFIKLWFTDLLGFAKSFTITADELENALEEGMGFDGSSIQGFARIDESDMIAKPDVSTFTILPWRPQGEASVARMFCDIFEPDGTPYKGDPRYVLKRNLNAAQEMGFEFFGAPNWSISISSPIQGHRPSTRGATLTSPPSTRRWTFAGTRCSCSRRWA